MNNRIKYLISFLLILLCEAFIALFVNDGFVRPYVGDVLVTVLLYCLVRIALPNKPKLLALYIFIFSIIVEFLQLINITRLLGIENTVLKTLIGTNFDVLDILCYGIGCIIAALAQLIIKKERENKLMTINIAIDGPAGAGKSTIARECAKRLGFIYTDTGALYRAIGLYAVNCGKDYTDPAQVIPCLKKINLSLKYKNGVQAVMLSGNDVSEAIRTPEISLAASGVSAMPEVRAFLLELQRSIASKNNVIMDGRDIGTVILPNAQVKIFLTASAQERAKRRCNELAAKGINVSFEEVYKDMLERDRKDSTREVAPLKPAEDAVIVDTTGLDIEQSIEAIINIYNSRCKNE